MAASDDLALALRQLDTRTIRDLQRLWPSINWADVDSYPKAMIVRIIRRGHEDAIAEAASYLQAAKPSGDAVIVPAQRLDTALLDTSARVTVPVAFKRGIAAGKTVENAAKSSFVQASGMATRHVRDGARGTVMRSAFKDPDALGWRRTGSGRTCGFCLMLIGRGAVFRESTATFRSHDHCHCGAEVVWRDAGSALNAQQTRKAAQAQDRIVARRK